MLESKTSPKNTDLEMNETAIVSDEESHVLGTQRESRETKQPIISVFINTVIHNTIGQSKGIPLT